MTKLNERPSPAQRTIPATPKPSAASGSDGMEQGRELARRYVPDNVLLYASIAHSPESEASLHTKMLSARQIDAIAGVIPQVTPAPPQQRHEEAGDGSGPA